MEINSQPYTHSYPIQMTLVNPLECDPISKIGKSEIHVLSKSSITCTIQHTKLSQKEFILFAHYR